MTQPPDLIAAARGLCAGEDWNNGTHAKFHGYRQKLIDAVAALPPDAVVVSRELLREADDVITDLRFRAIPRADAKYVDDEAANIAARLRAAAGEQ